MWSAFTSQGGGAADPTDGVGVVAGNGSRRVDMVELSLRVWCIAIGVVVSVMMGL